MIGFQGNDYHPPGDLRTGENLLANIYTSLIANQDAWNETLLVITFDEHGGLYDHIPPPKAIAPDNNFQNGFEFDRYGVRVPTSFISPQIQKGTVIRSDDPSVPFDHTSLIATILKWRNIDKSLWNMGLRVHNAPTFESVITGNVAPINTILVPEGVTIPTIDVNNIVSYQEPFYLKSASGDYVVITKSGYEHIAHVGLEQNKVTLEFLAGSGALTHGSFVLIKSNDANLNNGNLLRSSLWGPDCIFDIDQRTTENWWTIKSVDYPFLGYPIQNGDRIYLENHVYLDPFKYLPCRLAEDVTFFGKYLLTLPLTDQDCDNSFWIIEKSF